MQHMFYIYNVADHYTQSFNLLENLLQMLNLSMLSIFIRCELSNPSICIAIGTLGMSHLHFFIQIGIFTLAIFSFCIFLSGKLVEEEEGNIAMWLSYILIGAGINPT